MNCRNINLILTTWNLPLLPSNWCGRVDGVILGQTGVQDRSPPLPLAGRGRSRAGLDAEDVEEGIVPTDQSKLTSRKVLSEHFILFIKTSLLG